jgi:hypothetical protein
MLVSHPKTVATPESLANVVRRRLMIFPRSIGNWLCFISARVFPQTNWGGRSKFHAAQSSTASRVRQNASPQSCPKTAPAERSNPRASPMSSAAVPVAPSGLYRKIEARLRRPADHDALVSRRRRAALQAREFISALWRFLSSGERTALSHVE